MWTATHDALTHMTALVQQTRPAWDESLVRVVLVDLAPRVDGTDLAVAALRAAQDPTLPGPRAIAWRGKHWRDLTTTPPEAQQQRRCGVCQKPESRCWSERPGADDDHQFEPT